METTNLESINQFRLKITLQTNSKKFDKSEKQLTNFLELVLFSFLFLFSAEI